MHTIADVLAGRATWAVECGDGVAGARALPTGFVSAVVTDPPYPNNAGYFTEGVKAAVSLMQSFLCNHWLVFWHELEVPPVPLPLVAKHIWHRSNTNRPDNYEAIYEFCADGRKRASRVLSFPVIYPGLTGCIEATRHPTQKNQKMMEKLLDVCKVGQTVLDPFMGSGTTGVACALTGRNFIGCEIDPAYHAIAVKRLSECDAIPPLVAAAGLFD